MRRPIAYPVGSIAAEELALVAGWKPMMQRFIGTHEVSALRAHWVARGFSVVVAELGSGGSRGLAARPPPKSAARTAEAGLRLLVESESVEGAVATPSLTTPLDEAPVVDPSVNPGSESRCCVYVSRGATRLGEALACHATTDEARMGLLLGYPACCAAAYAGLPDRDRSAAASRRALSCTPGRCYPRLNNLDLAIFHYLSWSPCSFSCEPSVRWVDAIAARILARATRARVRIRPFLEQMDRALAVHRLVVLDHLQFSVAGVCSNGEVTVERVWPTAQDRHPEVPLDRWLCEASARLLSHLEPARQLAVRDGVLFADGRPLLRTPHLLLVPFGAVAGP